MKSRSRTKVTTESNIIRTPTDTGVNINTSTSQNTFVKSNKYKVYSNGVFIEILGIVVIILLFSTVLSSVFNNSSEIRTFDGFLNSLQNFNFIDINWLYNLQSVDLGDWGFLNFLRDFVYGLVPVFQYLMLIVTGAINALGGLVQVIGYFLGF